MKSREKVIIVGGGPVGLLCALNLATHDVPVLVLEAYSELFMDLRAGSFHPPTLEVMEPLGLTAKLLEIGIPVHKWQLRDREKGVIGTFELSLLGDETPFPFRLHLEQHRFTPIVLEQLRKIPHAEVRFSCRVEDVAQTGSGVRVSVQTPDGLEEFEGGWVIGADGGGSIVRKSAGIEFDGFTFPERFALISTTYDLGQHGFTDTAYISHPVEWCAVFRLPDQGPPGLWRFLYGCDPNESEQEALSEAVIQQRLQSVQPKPTPYEIVHRTIYRVHQRVATTFRNGRILIAGDAAHLNNPIGGFGLNCGLQDAMNLTDKLIRVIRETVSDDLLDRYVRQRRTANIEYVQESSIRNKRLLEETDESIRLSRLDDMRRASQDPSLAKAVLMRSSMIDSMRRANTII
ncbi:FAD-dependent monooxygenase [Bradyrhizobium sp. dw_78]|uniref:FAD-dependent oxidoreductase n=1 Tax=Bradyrhizobium sp. dw_78 TaxID=2719793 RepID=UPI001BD5B5E3|nr:FAD-dependent monooxygenase [Bradyrhizobium sp. dw_78]